MSYTLLDASDFDERRKPVAATLDARAIKMNQFDNQPDQPGKEHDEGESGQEEIYVLLRGQGGLRVDGEEVTLEPGRYLLVPPEATRQVSAGREGLSYLVVGTEVPGA
jgi:quercetin dioxygenase-like cupin family protein